MIPNRLATNLKVLLAFRLAALKITSKKTPFSSYFGSLFPHIQGKKRGLLNATQYDVQVCGDKNQVY